MQDQTIDQQEVEWQFETLDLLPVVRWLENRPREPEPEISFRGTREISDTYLDTDNWRINRAGYALRIRSVKGERKTETTMKRLASENGPSGLKSRREISETLDVAEPEDLISATGPVGVRVRTLSGYRPLRSLFELETRRSAYALSLGGSEVGEVALDETAIPLQNGTEPTRLRRVEVEMEPEAVSLLKPFVERLRDECRLSPAATSKYEAGLFASGFTPPAPSEFGPTEVDG